MKMHIALAVVLTAGAAFAQPNVVVTTDSPWLKPNADLLQRVTADAVRKYAPAQMKSVSIAIVSGYGLMFRDASTPGGYWEIENSYATSSSHAVPLLGGTTVAQVGFLPTVSATGGTIGAGPGALVTRGEIGSTQVLGVGSIAARYAITDANGKVIESQTIPLATSRFIPGSLEAYRDTGAYIARRVANLR